MEMHIEVDEVIELLMDVVGGEALLEEIDEDEIESYVVNNFDIPDLFLQNHTIQDYIDWDEMKNNISATETPEDLYGSEWMLGYVMENYAGHVMENYRSDMREDIILELQDDDNPEDVYSEDQLREWAESNGYVKETN